MRGPASDRHTGSNLSQFSAPILTPLAMADTLALSAAAAAADADQQPPPGEASDVDEEEEDDDDDSAEFDDSDEGGSSDFSSLDGESESEFDRVEADHAATCVTRQPAARRARLRPERARLRPERSPAVLCSPWRECTRSARPCFTSSAPTACAR